MGWGTLQEFFYIALFAGSLTTLISHDLGSTRTLITLLPLDKRFTMIIYMLGGFEQAANSIQKNSKKSTLTLETPTQVRISPNTIEVVTKQKIARIVQ